MLGLTITSSVQVLNVLMLLVFQDTWEMSLGLTLVFQLALLVATAIIGSILGLIGWVLGWYLPEAAQPYRSS